MSRCFGGSAAALTAAEDAPKVAHQFQLFRADRGRSECGGGCNGERLRRVGVRAGFFLDEEPVSELVSAEQEI